MNYLWDSEFHLFKPERAGEFNYSDGLEVEQRLLDIVSHAADRSTFSPELARSINDWPSEYHLSRRRHCLLRPLAIPAGSRVLELGCGCGAITRYLGETGAQVLAVEGSLMRGRIAAQRCRELSNVRVVVDDLLNFQTEERFDYVLLIGVLEYAARFSKSQKPFESYLQVVTRRLVPGGKLVVAIENQLGMKYLNGCTEDHVGTRFFGIQDLYGGTTARTFGRRELQSLIQSAGLPHASFYYPFPDYKLPSVVLSSRGLIDPAFNAADVIAHCVARDYNGSPYRGFDEALAAAVIHRNGLLADLSNSFLVVATAEAPPVQAVELAFSWSADRIPELCTQTRFVREGGAIEVRKEPLIAASTREITLPGDVSIRHHARGAPYVKGGQLLAALKKARAQSGELSAVVEAVQPWIAYLMRYANRMADSAGEPENQANPMRLYVVPGKLLDCMPSNLLDTGEELVPIDVEWDSDRSIPLGWVVTRGLIWSLMSGLPRASNWDLIADLVPAVCARNGFSVEASDIRRWMELEAAFQTSVTGKPWTPADLRHTSGGMRSFSEAVDQLTDSTSSKGETPEDREEQLRASNARLAAKDLELARVSADQNQLRRQLDAMKSAPASRANSWRMRRAFKRDRRLAAESGFFDRSWYLAHNPDVAASGQEPLTHYLRYGGFEGRAPGPDFDSRWYLDQHPDVSAHAINPLIHYLRFGREEGRKVKPDEGTAKKS